MNSNFLKSTKIISEIWSEFRHKKLPLSLLFLLVLNLIISPIVQASTGGILSRGQSYAVALLGLVTFSLFLYLFVVIFQPEKF
jgi:K+-transporting ATPase KdpF subunit